MTVQSLDAITTHHDIAITDIASPEKFEPATGQGASKYKANLPNGAHLEALLINKSSDVLVVALHGATNRRTKELPRFEWMRSLRNTEYSSMYFSDPCLELDEKLELAWYTGWKDYDLYPVIAEWIIKAAQAIRASRILILGSSGGGLAALQVSALIQGSMALPFSCQTAISSYKVDGTRIGAQRSYLRAVMPHLSPEVALEKLEPGIDWAAPMGDRLSAVERYKKPLKNFVYYVQNVHDYPHVEQHYAPFRAAVEGSENAVRVRFINYEGPENHNPPTQMVFKSELASAVEWLREIR